MKFALETTLAAFQSRLSWRLPLVLLLCGLAHAHVGEHPSIHDTVAGIIERMRAEVSTDELPTYTVDQVVAFLSEEERHILGTEHISFRVNVPVRVSVIKDVRVQDEPFWLEERGFEKAEFIVHTDQGDFDVWQKDFEAGVVGLGVNSLSGAGDHYFVAIKSLEEDAQLEVRDIYPGRHTLGLVRDGERAYVGWKMNVLQDPPAEITGDVLLRGDNDKRRDAQLTQIFIATDYVATETPDQIVLTWSDDPKTTQTIQWRTSTAVDSGAVRYQRAPENGTPDPEAWEVVEARTKPLENDVLVNDPVVHRHTVVLRDLEPGTQYFYAVRDGDGWLDPVPFETAPGEVVPFKFVYMGDAQNGLDTWGKLLEKAHDSQPDAEFYIMAGDLVNRGNERNDWDSFFYNAESVFDRRQLVPAIGNHEDQGPDGPWMYLELFELPDNGPRTITSQRAYSFSYSNALFVVLDSNLPPDTQAEWLERELAASDATWKFVVYHHPLYSSGPRRDNPRLRDVWGAIFDRYKVDLALQGHDHAYLRTYPMHGGERVASPAEGTIYIISVSGTKMYEQAPHDYIEFGMTNVATYQVLDIEISDTRLTYKAYDINGDVRDEFVIEK